MTKLQRAGLLFYILGIQVVTVCILQTEPPALLFLLGIVCLTGGALATTED